MTEPLVIKGFHEIDASTIPEALLKNMEKLSLDRRVAPGELEIVEIYQLMESSKAELLNTLEDVRYLRAEFPLEVGDRGILHQARGDTSQNFKVVSCRPASRESDREGQFILALKFI